MSTSVFVFNSSLQSATNFARNYEKSNSMVEPSTSGNQMSYKSTDIPKLQRHQSENATALPRQNYEDLVSCSVCIDLFDNNNQLKLPKVLPCQHSYCVECINNLMHVSSEKGKFDCPQCKFKVENVKNASDLPTNRMVLALLEKESLNYQGYASCPSCRQIRNLEVCFECNLPLCNQCVGKHFESWKNDINTRCFSCEENLETYKQKIDQINPYIAKNFESVDTVRKEIDEAFNILFQRLNSEKEILLKTVTEIKDEKFVFFKDVAALIASLKVFRDTNDNYEKKLMSSRIKKIQQNFDIMVKLEQDFSNLAHVPFKIIERFERKQLPGMDFNFSGSLIVNEYNIESSNRARPSLPPKPQAPLVQNVYAQKVTIPRLDPPTENLYPVRGAASAPSAPSLSKTGSVSSLTSISSNNSAVIAEFKQKIQSGQTPPLDLSSGGNLTNWILTANIKPQIEFSLNLSPSLITSHSNILYCMDNSNSSLTIFEKSTDFKLKNSLKLNVPNIRAIAVNDNYFALSYSNLKKEHLKGSLKNMNANGVLLFRREQFVVCSVYDKSIELKNNEAFKSPSGLAFTEKFLLVCDRELRTVFKIDLRTFAVVQRLCLKDGEPYSISANKETFMINDIVNSSVYAFNTDTFNQLSCTNLKVIDQVSGAFNLALAEDGLCFVRNSENQICMLDAYLEQRAFFNEVQAKILSIAMINVGGASQMLIIGGVNGKQQFKLYGYFVQ